MKLPKLIMVLALAALSVFLFTGTAHAATPDQEQAACAAVFHYHHVFAIDDGGVHATWADRAWYHAWHLARYADPDLRYAIRHYLYTGSGWSVIPWECGSGL